MNAFDLFCGILQFLIIGCGICGNVLSFLVWTKGRRCRKQPGGIHLRSLAVSDTIALLLPAFNESITLTTPLNTKVQNDFFCKLEMIGRHFSLMVSTWIIVSFTLERTVAILRPTVTTNLVSKKGTIALMVLIFVVSFLMNVPYGIVYEIKQEAVISSSVPNTSHPLTLNNSEEMGTNSTTPLNAGAITVSYERKCDADKASMFHLENWYHIWVMDVPLIFIIPFTIMTGSNMVVVYLLVARKTSMVDKLDAKIRAVTIRAVAISTMHCIASGSFTMSILFPDFLDKGLYVKYSNEYYGLQITYILAYINHAVNFLLYSFFGTDFRRDCADLFIKKASTVHPEDLAQQTKSKGDDKSQSQGDTGIGSKTGQTSALTVGTV